MKTLSGSYNLKTGEYSDFSEGVYSYVDGSLSVSVFGFAYTDGALNNGANLSVLYREHGADITKHLNGTYIVLFYDCDSGVLRVFHDRATSPVALYYAKNGGTVYFSTSLKDLLKKSGVERRFNESVVEEFLLNGFIYGDSTLVEGVKKLKAYKSLEVSGGTVKLNDAVYPMREMTPGQALDCFKQTLDDAVKNCIDGDETACFPLSSGYDSNYIAYVSTEICGKQSTAFSVGGKRGKNELPIVKENVKCYKNLELKSAVTDGSSLKNLPDIVYRLEGNVYESGIFLQYELMKLVSESGVKKLVCGECADQVMNVNYHKKGRIYPESPDGKPLYYEFSEYPYIFSSYLIFKKSGILANSFGIETVYPYLDENVISVCAPLGTISMKDKRVHVANCRACLNEEIFKNMSKKGGSTDCRSLFENDEEIKSFFKRIEGTEFYKKYSGLILSDSVFKKEKLSASKRIKTIIRNIILVMLHKKSDDSYLVEMKLRAYLCAAYLIIFKKLFIETDGFERDGCDIAFEDFIK
ncbi:MAG: hypothetical protein J5562_07765 [Clostridia bacterium]|nr:hypothetical protein [Clostridia bacterium]